MKSIILFLKGLIIGIGRIIPGVSGSVIAISLGVYETGIDAISNFSKNSLKNLKFLITIGLGIIISIVFFSKVISYTLDYYYLYTMILFIGLIIGGIPELLFEIKGKSNKKNIFAFIVTFSLVMALVFLSPDTEKSYNGNSLILILVGIIDAATMIIPGISGTAVLMLLGFYEATLDFFANLGDFHLFVSNIKLVIAYATGLLIGGVAFVKVMEYSLKKHRITTYFVINAFALSSILMMIMKVSENSYKMSEVLISILFFIFGLFISRLLSKSNKE